METVRVPIKVNRKSINVLKKLDASYGGWAHVKPNTEKPKLDKRLPDNKMLLFCPYCAEWTIYVKDGEEYYCTSWCGWANTNDYYVKKYNNLFPNEMGSIPKKKVVKK